MLEDLSLIVHEGEAVALLGRNGVGKTTTLRAIAGTVRASSGHVTLDNAVITNARPYEINQRGISLVPEGRRLFPNLTVLDNLLVNGRVAFAGTAEMLQADHALQARLLGVVQKEMA